MPCLRAGFDRVAEHRKRTGERDDDNRQHSRLHAASQCIAPVGDSGYKDCGHGRLRGQCVWPPETSSLATSATQSPGSTLANERTMTTSPAVSNLSSTG